MKQKTFNQAQELQDKIFHVTTNIDRIVTGDKGCSGMALNLSFHNDEDKKEFQKYVLYHLKKQKAKLEKEFNNLK